ncbi:Uu.00g065520.m01.CDS01 [Anthostomella pinea]|uniref:Uu.00g065520.m01.CDS01 n=1 Tax=Anthostomella pinea TaxID=933095 RepID=A0AAI8VTQ6_9PEZI|nr:Uu.00g065520.m01.CDS01 [Anthostomella pinea]
MPDQLYDASLTLVVVSAMFIPVCTILTSLRMWVRWQYGNVGIDDWLLFVGLIIWIPSTCVLFPACYNGLGMHDGRYTKREGIDAMMYFYLFQDLYVWANIPIKLSLCVTLMRLGETKRWMTWTLYVIMFLIALTSALSNIFILSSCTPAAALWDKTLPHYTCRDWRPTIAIAIIYSVVNIFTDFIVALLPVFLLWKLQLAWRQKLAVMGVLSLGILASCATLIRIHTFKFGEENDYLYRMAGLVLWTVIEMALAQVAGSLVAFRPLARRVFGMFSQPTQEPRTSIHTIGQSSRGQSSRGQFRRATSDDVIGLGDLDGRETPRQHHARCPSRSWFKDRNTPTPSQTWLQDPEATSQKSFLTAEEEHV